MPVTIESIILRTMSILPFAPSLNSEDTAPDFGSHIISILKSWWGIITGGSIAFLLYLAGSGGNIIWLLVFTASSMGSLLTLGYWMWRDERNALIAKVGERDLLIDKLAREKVEIEKDRVPEITGCIRGFHIHQTHDLNSDVDFVPGSTKSYKAIGTRAVVDIGFVCRNADISVINFSMNVVLSSGEYEATEARILNHTWDSESQCLGKLINSSPRPLFKKGQRIDGHIAFDFAGVILQQGDQVVSYSVTIFDAWENPHIISEWPKSPALVTNYSKVIAKRIEREQRENGDE